VARGLLFERVRETQVAVSEVVAVRLAVGCDVDEVAAAATRGALEVCD
jgi:hypothetical protein